MPGSERGETFECVGGPLDGDVVTQRHPDEKDILVFARGELIPGKMVLAHLYRVGSTLPPAWAPYLKAFHWIYMGHDFEEVPDPHDP